MDGKSVAWLHHLAARARRFLGQRLERGWVRFVSWTVLLMALLLLAISYATFTDGHTVFGPPLGADYTGFYTAGTILHHYPADRLYDVELHDQLYHRLLPEAPAEEKLPYVYPPFFALLLRVLARLPYTWSYSVWLLLTVGLYLGGLALVRGLAGPALRAEWSTVLLLALSFEPFLFECGLGGQTSAFGFCCLALALRLEHLRRPTTTGLAVGLGLYKPTLLVLLVPMFLVARRWRTLLGFGLTSLALAGVCLLVVGWDGALDYVRLLVGFTGAIRSTNLLRTWKYVDLLSFFRLLLGGPSPWAGALVLASAAACLPFLVRAWWRWNQHDEAYQKLVWAATLTWTLVFNLYVGVYDTILAVLGALLTADVLGRRDPAAGLEFSPRFRSLLVLLYLVPLFSQSLARQFGFQPYTLVLLALGGYQLSLARRLGRPGSAAAPG